MTVDRGELQEAAVRDARAAERSAAGLRSRTRKVIEEWSATLESGWDPLAVARLYDEFERVATGAEELGLAELAEPALQLTVYLCTFVDGHVQPTAAQKQQLSALLERLGSVSGMNPQRIGSGQSPVPVAAAVAPKVAFYVRPPDRESVELARQLGAHGYVVRPLATPAEAEAALAAGSPDALLVDAALLSSLHALTDAAEHGRRPTRARAVCVVVGTGIGEAEQQFAQRSGADEYLDLGDAIAVASRLDTLVGARRNLDFRVLIVEDDAAQALFCESILKHRGIATRSVARAADVTDQLADFKPDLVLLDLYLPDANGIEVAQRIRARAEHAFLPIVFLSGEQDLDKRFNAIAMGGDSFIAKPVRPRHLIGEIETRIKRARTLAGRVGGRGERRGALAGRKVFFDEIARAAHEEGIVALTLIAASDPVAAREALGFVAAGEVSFQVATALSTTGPLLHPVCSYAEFGFLGLTRGPDVRAIEQGLAQLRAGLRSREWHSIAAPRVLDFALASVRVSGRELEPEALLREVVAAHAKASVDGSRVSVSLRLDRTTTPEAAEQRVLRALLVNPLLPDAVAIDFRALHQLNGELGGQFDSRVRLRTPRLRQAIELAPADWRARAREVGTLGSIERQTLRMLLARVRARLGGAVGTRIYVGLSVESVRDAAFAPWLAAELITAQVPARVLAFEVDAAEVAPHGARLNPALEALQTVGVRLSLGGLAGGNVERKLVHLPSFDRIRIRAPATSDGGAWMRERGELISEGLRYGKVVIADEVRDARELAELHKLGVHYLASDAMAAWSAELEVA